MVDPRVPGLPPNPATVLPWIDRDQAGAVDSASLPGGHLSREVKVEFGGGPVSGAVVLTVELGKTGIPVGDHVRLIESTAAVKLNGFVSRLETSLMNAELDAEIFEGFKIAIEANALTVGVEGDETDLDLLSVSLKVVGDATKLLGAPAGMTISLDGRLTMSLGGRLAAKLAQFTAAQLERKAAAKLIEETTREAAKHALKVKGMKEELAVLEKVGRKHYPRAATLRRQIAQGEKFLENNAKRLGQMRNRLGAAKRKAAEAIAKVRGKIAKQIAKAMEKKAVAALAKTLSKVVPMLNLVSAIIDIAELTVSLVRLLSGDAAGSGGDEEASEEGGTENAESREGTSSDPADESTGETDDGEGGDSGDKRDENQTQEPPSPATSILEHLTRKGPGPQLDDDQRMMIRLLVPADLTPAEIAEVIALLKQPMSRATSAEDVIVAVSNAVKEVRARTRKQAVAVNGVPVAANEAADLDTSEPTRTGGEPGPITSPDQVGPITPLEIVETGEPSVIARWFEVRSEVLVMSAEGRAWVDAHRFEMLASNIRLADITHAARRIESGIWDLTITFVKNVDGIPMDRSHSFFVVRGLDARGIGVQHGDLTFEPYQILPTG